MFVGAATDEIFARYPSVQAAYETASALRRDPVCGVFRTQTQGMAAAARALAAELRANSTAAGLRFMALDSSIETAGIAPADLVALTSDVTSALAALDATPGSYLPDDADTDRAFTSIISAFGAVSNLLEASDPLVDDSNRVDAIGPLAASLDDYRSWSGLLPSLGAEVRRSSLSDGIATDLPLADAEDVTELQRAQQFLRDNPLTAAERQALIDAGADDDLIDAAVAAIDGLDIGILTTTTASQLDDALTLALRRTRRPHRGPLHEPACAARSAVARPDRGGRLRHHRSRHSGRHHTARIRRAEGDFVDVEVATPPTHGEVSASLDTFVYVPEPGFTGTDTFTYRATDRTNTSGIKTITVDVKLPAPTPAPDSYGLRQGDTLVVPAPGVLTNDSTPRIPLTAELVTQPTQGVVELQADGSLAITAPPDRSGTYTFTYRAAYPGSAPSDPVTVTIDVIAVRSPPVASPDSVSTPEDTPVDVTPLANDGDPDGDTLTLVGVTRPTHGTVRCAGSTCTYTPVPNYSGPDEFRYTVSDGTGRRSLGVISVTVTPVDDTPIAVPDLLSFDTGVPGVVDVLANDTHPDGRLVLQFVSAACTTNGSLDCTPAGVCTYTPNDVTIVSDQATYTIREPRGN